MQLHSKCPQLVVRKYTSASQVPRSHCSRSTLLVPLSLHHLIAERPIVWLSGQATLDTVPTCGFLRVGDSLAQRAVALAGGAG